MSKKKLQIKTGRCRDILNRLVGWLNVATSPEGCTAVDARKLREYNHGLANGVDFYKSRCEVLLKAQKTMRDPERKTFIRLAKLTTSRKKTTISSFTETYLLK